MRDQQPLPPQRQQQKQQQQVLQDPQQVLLQQERDGGSATLIAATRPSQVAKKGNCYGCGASLQTYIPSGAGYVKPDKYETKARHRQLKQVLCERCSGLCNGAMIPAVEDFAQKQQLLLESKRLMELRQQQEAEVGEEGLRRPEGPGGNGGGADAGGGPPREQLLGKLLVSPEELREKLMEVRGVKAVVVLLVDLLDVSGTLMGKVRDMVGGNPIVLVGTKMDLLPQGAAPKEVSQWLVDLAAAKRLNVTSCHLVSSHTGDGVEVATSKICRERKGRDVFVVGAANVGKSAFVRAMLREMSRFEGANFDAAAMANSRYLPVESAMPGTTLGLIPLQAFESGGTLYDTPGVHLHHRVPHMLSPDELRRLHPRRRLRAFKPPTPLELSEEDASDGNDDTAGPSFRPPGPTSGSSKSSTAAASDFGAPRGPQEVGGTYLWSGLARLDVLSAPPSASFVFYGPPALRCAALPLLKDGQTAEIDFSEDGEEDGGAGGRKADAPLDVRASVEARGGLVPHDLTLRPPPPIGGSGGSGGAFGRAPLADVAVSGVPGWISVSAPRARRPLQLRVWAPRGVEVFLRPPLPCWEPAADGDEDEGGALSGLGGDDLGRLLGLDEEDDDWAEVKGGLNLKELGLEGEEEAVRQLLFGGGGGGSEEEEESWEWMEGVGGRGRGRRGVRPVAGRRAGRLSAAREEEDAEEDAEEGVDSDDDDHYDAEEDDEEASADPWEMGAGEAGAWGEVEAPKPARGGGGGGRAPALSPAALMVGMRIEDALGAARGFGARKAQGRRAEPAGAAGWGGGAEADDEDDDDLEGASDVDDIIDDAPPSSAPEGYDPVVDEVKEGWVTLKRVDISEVDPGQGETRGKKPEAAAGGRSSSGGGGRGRDGGGRGRGRGGRGRGRSTTSRSGGRGGSGSRHGGGGRSSR